MDVFGLALADGGAFLRDAVIAAAHELGVFEALPIAPARLPGALGVKPRRLAALVDVLVAIGVLELRGNVLVVPDPAARPTVVRAGWGLLAEVIRRDRPLAPEAGELELRYHRHLLRAGAAAARELAPVLGTTSLLDLGGGAGAYTAAFLDACDGATATLVDAAPVLALAAEELARFGARVRLCAGDAREVAVGDDHAAVLLANVLHLHGPIACAELCRAAARAVAPGGSVVVKDLRADTLEGRWFALDMAIYTNAGDVHPVARVRDWLAEAGLVAIEERQLASAPDAMVVIARRPGMPAGLRRHLTRALAIGDREALERYYLELMPQMRAAQLAPDAQPAATYLHAPLAWTELPRLSAALDRLFALVDHADVDPIDAFGAPSAEAFRARTPTLAALYVRTHYGAAMPLLYGYPADLAYIHARGLPPLAAIDRYLTAPILHELCHFSRERDAVEPPHLDECIAGWLGVHIHPEFAYPAANHDDAIFAAPWLAQVGQAIARAFGVRAVVRAHAGIADALPAEFTEVAARLGWDDWSARRTLHFLSDTFDPAPWVALAFVAAAGRSLTGVTLRSLACTPLAELEVPSDRDFDRAIVGDALRAMCLDTALVDGSFRTRTRLPDGPITLTSAGVTAPRRGELAPAPSYWLPPAVGVLLAGRFQLHLTSIAAIPELAAAVCEGDLRAFTAV